MTATVGDSKFWDDLEKKEITNEHLEKYEKKYKVLLAKLEKSVNAAAVNDPDAYRFLINKVELIMLKGFRLLLETENNKAKK